MQLVDQATVFLKDWLCFQMYESWLIANRFFNNIQHHFPWLGSPSEEGSFLWEAPASCLKECLWMLRALVLPDCDCRCTRCSNSHHFPFMLFHAIGLVIVMSVRKRCQIRSGSFQCVKWKWIYTDTNIGNFSKRRLESGQAEFGSDLY